MLTGLSTRCRIGSCDKKYTTNKGTKIMCMIGSITNIQRDDPEGLELIESVTKLMLEKMSESGNTHGAGIALSYHNNEGILTLKSGNTGAAMSQVLELDKSMAFKHILLHTRFSTGGAANEVNAHPHAGPSGVLIHNGWNPELYNAIKYNWHLNSEVLRKRLADFNESGDFVSDCDSEALALIFNPDPNEFAKDLIGEEIFAIMHLDNAGKNVTVFTQYNTVHMMYSHALEATVMCTRKEVLESVQEYLGEVWPIVQVDHDYVMYFDGQDLTGGPFDFTDAAMKNLEKYYEAFGKKEEKKEIDVKVYDADCKLIDERDDLDTYFKSSLEKENEWQKTTLDDGSTVWEHSSGEIIHCDAETVEELSRYADFDDFPEESEIEIVGDEPRRDFLDRDFEKIQAAIQKQISSGVSKKTS